MRHYKLLLALLFLAVGCAHEINAPNGRGSAGPEEQIAASAEGASVQARNRVPPLVDYHQHLMSSANAELVNGEALPPVTLPSDLARFLQQRETEWNDKEALAPLYTKDSTLFLSLSPTEGWVRGRSAVAAYVSELFANPYLMTPIAYEMRSSAGHISGYLTRSEDGVASHFGYFQLALSRGDDEMWRIASEMHTFRGPRQEPYDAEQLVSALDAAGIDRAVVLSTAFFHGSEAFDFQRHQETSAERYPKVRAENDWTAEQVARFPDRLVAFCSFGPLEGFAMAELDRCAGNPIFKGLKLHLDEGGVDLRIPEHVQKVRALFAAANKHGLAITVHVGNNQESPSENRKNVETFLNEIVSAAPDVTVQVAHLWGGQGFSESALAAYAHAVSSGHPSTRNLVFDLAEAPLMARLEGERSEEVLQKIAAGIRQIGLKRILYGSDGGGLMGHLEAPAAVAQFWSDLPLTDKEFRIIAGNLMPYLNEQVAIAVESDMAGPRPTATEGDPRGRGSPITIAPAPAAPDKMDSRGSLKRESMLAFPPVLGRKCRGTRIGQF